MRYSQQLQRTQIANLTEIRELVQRVRAGQIYLVSGPGRLANYVAQELIDRLGALGQVFVIVGGNRYTLEGLPLLLGQQPELMQSALERIYITRGETCYQLLDALQNTHPHQSPLVVTDLLDTLSDADIESQEGERLLGEYLRHLRRLSEHTPVLVSLAEPQPRPRLVDYLRSQVDDEVRLLPVESEAAAWQPVLLPED